MKKQKPAEGIMKTHDFDDVKGFRVACQCSDSSHDILTWVEIEKDNPEVTVSFFTESKIPFWKEGFNRFKYALKLIIHGTYESENHTIMSKQQAINFAHALIDSVKELENKKHK